MERERADRKQIQNQIQCWRKKEAAAEEKGGERKKERGPEDG